jgi:hypothetical protein
MKFKQKLDNLLWFLITLLPLILLLIHSIINKGIGGDFNNLINSFMNFIGLENNSIFNALNNFITSITNTNTSIYIILIDYAIYILIVQLVHLIIDFFMFIIKVCENFLNRGDI